MIRKSMPSHRRDILGVTFDLIDYQEALGVIHRWREMRQESFVTITNPHSVMLCRRVLSMGAATAEAGMTLPDGIGSLLAASILVVKKINATNPDIVWVGLGAPKQEEWMAEHVGRINAAAMIGVGAAFDFHSGNGTWAPLWIRKTGMEWLYRLAKNPKRMWRRNLDSPLFLLAVIWQRLSRALNGKAGDAEQRNVTGGKSVKGATGRR